MSKIEIPQCPICYSELGAELGFLNCGHVFHKICLAKTFENKKKQKCPLCRNVSEEVFSLFFEINHIDLKEEETKQMLLIYEKQQSEKQIEIEEKIMKENYVLQKEISAREAKYFQLIEQRNLLRSELQEEKRIYAKEQEKEMELMNEKKNLLIEMEQNDQNVQKQKDRINTLGKIKSILDSDREQYDNMFQSIQLNQDLQFKLETQEQLIKQFWLQIENLKIKIKQAKEENMYLINEQLNIEDHFNLEISKLEEPKPVLRKSRKITKHNFTYEQFNITQL